jgi:hypothetical protein
MRLKARSTEQAGASEQEDRVERLMLQTKVAVEDGLIIININIIVFGQIDNFDDRSRGR